MLRPAILSLGHRVSPRALGLGLVAVLTIVIGVVGQGSFGVGAAVPAAVGVVVTDVVGGAGGRAPVRVTVSLAVTNLGTDQIRVLEPDSDGDGTAVLNLTPWRLPVDPNAIGRIDADVSLDCDRPAALRLPQLQVELRDGSRRGFPIGGSGMLLEACSRAAPAVRPLIITVPTASAPAGTERRLAVQIQSPTGRRTQVLAVRAGGVALALSPATVTVAGSEPVVVRLTAPTTCPIQWRVSGIPSALDVDLRPLPGPVPSSTPGPQPSATPDPAPSSSPSPSPSSSSSSSSSPSPSPSPSPTPDPGREPLPSSDFSASVRLRLGAPLTSWLLADSCAGPA